MKLIKSKIITRFAAVAILAGIGLDLLAGQGPKPTICTRSCWGARGSGGCSSMSTLNRAIIHHTAGSYTTSYATAKIHMRDTQNLHMDGNGWCDIGYHFLVSGGGHIFEGRSGSMSGLPRGAHDGANDNSFGFTCLGYFHPPNNNPVTATMRDSLYDVIAWRMPSAWSPYGSGSYNGNTVGYLDGHRKVKSTACPGDGLYNPYITATFSGGEARNEVNARKNGSSGSGSSSVITTGPVVLKNADGRLEVFMVGSDKALYHKWQTTVSGSWSSWSSLGGTIRNGITGLVDYQGLIHVFAVDDATTKVFHIRQSGGGWTPWVELGSTSANVMDGLSCVNRADGRIMVFGVNVDTLNVNRCMTTTPGGSWSSWAVVGTGGTLLNGLSAVVDHVDNVHVFAVDDQDYGLRHIRLQSDGTWTPWVNRGGDNNREVSAWRHVDGRVRVYTRHRVNKTVSGWAQGSPSGTWSGPVTISSGTVSRGLCVVTDAFSGDYPHIFAVSASSTAGVHIRLQAGGTWTPWVSLGGDLRSRVAAIQDVQSPTRLEAFAISSGGGTMHRVVQNSDGTWPTFSAFSTPLP